MADVVFAIFGWSMDIYGHGAILDQETSPPL